MIIFSACEEDNNPENNTDSNEPGPNEVWMENTSFVPKNKEVDVGTTVIWINKDSYDHTVENPAGLFSSDSISEGATFSYTFESSGIYDVECTIHPGMEGTISVGVDNTNNDDTDDSGGDNGSGY